MLAGVNSHRHADPFPEPPSDAAIARWFSALPARLGMVRHWRWWLIGSMLVVVALAVLRAPIGAWLWPETRAQALRAEAEQALAEGRLSASDGSGARELFEAALAMDPDRGEARQGLARVALAALAQARTALAEERFEDAHRQLALARALSVPRADADALAEALRLHEAGSAGVDDLFEQAGRAHVQGRLNGGDGALALYSRVLALDPAHAGALRGREDALAELLAEAREALRAGDLQEAGRLVARVRAEDPGHVDLPDTLARLVEEAGPDADRLVQALAEGSAGDPAGAAVGEGDAAVAPGALDAGERSRRAARLLADVAAGGTEGAGRDGALDMAAVARVGQARSLDPGSPAVAAAVARLLPVARACHARELRDNRLGTAGDCLEARAALGDDTAELASARRQLAERWLAVGDERLGAGEIGSARSALAGARRADASVPGLGDFEQRVRAAAAALRLD